MTKKRNKSLDMVSGILILWIVAHHACQFSKLGGLKWFFVMIPWFYFKSGMFFNPRLNESFIEHCKKRLVAFGIPLFFWGAVGYLVICPELVIVHDKPLWKIVFSPFYHILLSGDFLGNTPLWFLLSLLLVQLLAFPLIQIKYHFIIILLLLPAGFYLDKKSIILPLGASNLPLGLFFYFSGFFYAKYLSNINLKYFIMAATPLFFLINFYHLSYVDVHVNELEHGNYFVFVMMSLAAIIILIYFSNYIRSNFMIWIGQRSMYFFVIHWPIFYIIEIVFDNFKIPTDGYGFALVLFGMAVLLSFLIIKIMDKISGYWNIYKYL